VTGPPGDDAGCFAAVLLSDPQRLFAGAGGAGQYAGHRRAEQADHGRLPDFLGAGAVDDRDVAEASQVTRLTKTGIHGRR
jgi:hypothetical protein